MILDMNPADFRQSFRAGVREGHTSGLAPGFVQGNVAIVPGVHAASFAQYCRLNAQACPVLAMSAPGDWALPALGEGIDIRSDLPAYRVYRDGQVSVVTDVAGLWRDDLVTFVIGCSYTFERALIAKIPGAAGQPHTTITGAGHFLQEDRGPELTAVVALIDPSAGR